MCIAWVAGNLFHISTSDVTFCVEASGRVSSMSAPPPAKLHFEQDSRWRNDVGCDVRGFASGYCFEIWVQYWREISTIKMSCIRSQPCGIFNIPLVCDRSSLSIAFSVVPIETSRSLFIMEYAKKRRFSPVWEHFHLVAPNKVSMTTVQNTLMAIKLNSPSQLSHSVGRLS